VGLGVEDRRLQKVHAVIRQRCLQQVVVPGAPRVAAGCRGSQRGVCEGLKGHECKGGCQEEEEEEEVVAAARAAALAAGPADDSCGTHALAAT